MAPKKKGGRNSNNKKKNKGRARASASSVVASNSSGRGNQDPVSSLRNIRNLPTFHNPNEDAETKTGTTGGYYEIYKRSTTRFWKWMKEVLPQAKMTGVNDLRKGVDEILANNVALLMDTKANQDDLPLSAAIVAPKDVMQELSTSIRYRQLYSECNYGESGGDDGHRYIIEVLRYCRRVLRFGRQVARVAVLETNEQDETDEKFDGIGGRFNALILEDEEEDNDDELDQEGLEKNIRQRKFPTFEAPEKPEVDIDIEQVLINGDDRFQAMLLLRTMDDLMGAVDEHYGLLKRFLRGQDMHAGSSIQLLMECAVAANMATESVHAAENSLMANHPHLSSFYHVLALIFLPTHIADIEKKIDPAKLKQDPHMALQFVAEIVECSFHNKGDGPLPGKVKRFAKKSGIKLAVLEPEARQIHMLTSLEVQLANEEASNEQLNRLFETAGIRPHMWLRQGHYIGGDRCLLNTQNIVQKLMDIVPENTKLVGKPGFWGPQFDEQTNAAITIRGGLDEPFASSIMPELITICKKAPFEQLPETSQLITVLDLLQRHIKGERAKPIPIALSFGLHAMLTSIFVLQGNGDLARIASFAKQSYNNLFSQFDDLVDKSKYPENAPNFYINVGLFKNLVKFAKPVPSTYDRRIAFLDPSIAENLAFWNPLIGGEYMLYGTYICSVGLGSATVDSLGQLRFSLHLYNALKQCVPSLDVPFLQNMDKVFAKTKAVWVGGRPEKGSYCKHFWLAWGMSLSEATRVAFENGGNSRVLPANVQTQGQQTSDITRALVEIYPEEYSASYRCLVQHVFVDDEGAADYTVTNPSKEAKKQYGGLFDLLTRVNMTRDSMDDDEDLVLPTNFSAVGCILLKFTNSLSEFMGWDSIINEVIASHPEEMRTGKTLGGKRMKPGGFNASDLNMKRQGMAHVWSTLLSRLDANGGRVEDIDKVADFTKNFFKQIPEECYTFFVEQDDGPNSARRNPLEGSYPYGRTGRTPQDPLQGFCHFRYNKRGEPDVRVIKPGKYTPFHPTADGDVATPYEERGSKVRRGASGKYRHIASYSLDELIDLGWDGAMYTSTRGRHAAIGHYVPFIVGYDSDADDDYEPIDISSGKRAGTIGLPPEENGLYMAIPDLRNPGGRQLVQIKNAR